MPSLYTFARWEGIILVGGFFVVVFWRLLTGSISLGSLFEGDILDPQSADQYSSYMSAGRVQCVLITIFAALYYLLQVIHNPRAFPTLPNGLMGVLAGSHGAYLGGKAQAMLVGRLRDFLR